jgi:hypothetical protein
VVAVVLAGAVLAGAEVAGRVVAAALVAGAVVAGRVVAGVVAPVVATVVGVTLVGATVAAAVEPVPAAIVEPDPAAVVDATVAVVCPPREVEVAALSLSPQRDNAHARSAMTAMTGSTISHHGRDLRSSIIIEVLDLRSETIDEVPDASSSNNWVLDVELICSVDETAAAAVALCTELYEVNNGSLAIAPTPGTYTREST